MSNNNTFSPIEYAAPISDLKKRLDERKTVDEQNPANHNDSETSSSFSSGQTEIEVDTQLIEEAAKTTYEYYSIEEETSKWICNQCNSNRPKKYSCKTSKSILDYHLEHDHEIITPKKKRTIVACQKKLAIRLIELF